RVAVSLAGCPASSRSDRGHQRWHHDIAGCPGLECLIGLRDLPVYRDQLLQREVPGLLSVTTRLPVESEAGGPGHLGRRQAIRDRPDPDQIAEARRDAA